MLYDAIMDLPILTLADGMVVNTAMLNSVNKFSVVATTVNGKVGSVRFVYNRKSNARTEAIPPYSLCGGTGTDFYECAYLVVGQHDLTVTTYGGKRANGTIGSVETLSFRIVNIPLTKEPTEAPSASPVAVVTLMPTIVVSCNIPKVCTRRTINEIRTPLCVFLVSFSSNSSISSQFSTKWESIIPEYSVGAPEAQAERFGDDFVVFGGFSADFKDVTNQTFARDLSVPNRPWRRMDDMPVLTGITHAATTVIGTKMYMCGGYLGPQPGPHTGTCYIYDHSKVPGTGQWSNFATLPNNGSGGGGMIYDAASNALFYSGGAQRPKLGSTLTFDQNETWKFNFDNPTIGWIESTPIPYLANHQSHVTVYYQDRARHFFVGGQMGENEKQGNVADIFEFVASNETWIRRTSMPYGRGHTTVSTRAYGCGFLMAGGSINSPIENKMNRTSDIIFYSIPSDSWTSIGDLPVKGATPKLFVDDNEFLYYIDNRRSSRRKLSL